MLLETKAYDEEATLWLWRCLICGYRFDSSNVKKSSLGYSTVVGLDDLPIDPNHPFYAILNPSTRIATIQAKKCFSC